MVAAALMTYFVIALAGVVSPFPFSLYDVEQPEHNLNAVHHQKTKK
jgi:hypothetical protein